MNQDWSESFVGSIPSAGIPFPQSHWLKFNSVNGNPLATYCFPHETPRAIIVMFHGYNYCANGLTHVGKRLHNEGFFVCTMDFENHGQSGGEPGMVRTVTSYIEDASRYVTAVTKKYPGLPVFLLGESMGALVAIEVSLRMEVQGLVLFAPALGLPGRCNYLAYYLLVILSWAWPTMRKDYSDTRGLNSSNPIYCDWSNANPDVFTDPTPIISLRAIVEAMRQVERRMPLVTTPFLVVQGGEDYVTSAAHAQRFVQVARATDKKMIFIPGMYHAVTNEPLIDEILEEVVVWLNNRVKIT